MIPVCVDDLGVEGSSAQTEQVDEIHNTDAISVTEPTIAAAEQKCDEVDADGDALPVIANAAGKALIILNYLDILYRTESFTALRNAVPLKELLVLCIQCLSMKERQKLCLGVVPEFREVAVLHTTTKHQPLLTAILQEMAFSTNNMSLMQLLFFDDSDGSSMAASVKPASEHAGSLHPNEDDLQSLGSASNITKTSAQLRKEKKQKYAEQRLKDGKLRQGMSKQRQMLYELIQTDKISDIFAAQASSSAAMSAPGWGESADEASLAKDKEVFAQIANAMATQSIERAASPSTPKNS